MEDLFPSPREYLELLNFLFYVTINNNNSRVVV